jgi:hypothetical protein
MNKYCNCCGLDITNKDQYYYKDNIYCRKCCPWKNLHSINICNYNNHSNSRLRLLNLSSFWNINEENINEENINEENINEIRIQDIINSSHSLLYAIIYLLKKFLSIECVTKEDEKVTLINTIDKSLDSISSIE